MEPDHPIDDEQTRLWNGHAGRAWVDAQPIVDEMFEPIELLLSEGIPAGSAARVLDVGCGTGAPSTFSPLLPHSSHLLAAMPVNRPS